jgi:hypothetical protein
LVSSIKRFLIGRPLKSTELGEQKLNKTKALAILLPHLLKQLKFVLDRKQLMTMRQKIK